MTLLEALLTRRKMKQTPGKPVVPLHPDVADLAEVIEARLKNIEQDEK
jgi:hypothetical protein